MAKNKTFGLSAKNQQQENALKALMDPTIDLVIMTGEAGCGKSLLTVAAGLEQVLETKLYKEILFTRSPVAVGMDMGALPGELEDKMAPWCQGFQDSLEFLMGDNKITKSILDNKIKIQALMHVRGRSLHNKYVIVEESQNLSAAELKVLITRAGEDTKLVICGDFSQLDNKRLTKDNNGLYTLVGYAKNNDEEFIKHVHLDECFRSRLCNWALKF